MGQPMIVMLMGIGEEDYGVADADADAGGDG